MACWEYIYNENHHLVACKCSECERVVYENAPYRAYIFCPRCGEKITELPRNANNMNVSEYIRYLVAKEREEREK